LGGSVSKLTTTVEAFVPPPVDDLGTAHLVRCRDCGCEAETRVPRFTPVAGIPLARCPGCAGEMYWTFGGARFGFTMPARDFSATKIGQRRKAELTRRNEDLAHKQWERIDPKKMMSENQRVVNPTPGGPFDPHGPFAPRDPHRSVVDLGGSTDTS
jgi:hypothetical protein